MDRPDVLLVEDDGSIAQFVAASLGAAGFDARRAAGVAQARRELRDKPCDLLVVDLGLPDGDGTELIREVRASAATPILVLSARLQEDDKIAALDAGADDYLTKPFGVGELLARVRAMLRRAQMPARQEAVLRIGELTFDREARAVSLRGEPVHLSPTEFRLFERLARAPGKVVTHRQLLADVWGAEHVDQLHYLRIYMGHLRSKLEDDPAEPRWLLTELGVGYRFAED